jgi:hypothetical protein
VNSEELEQSLRSEFEHYLKSFRAEIRQEAAELQKRLNEAFEAYAARFDSEQELDEAFRSTVTEHLRLARDEGAKLTATAMVEAEQMERESGSAADHSGMRDAVAEISAQASQSAILKALVTHSAQFAPRGAFFIIKNDHFVGWKAFGGEDSGSENALREIHFPVSADTILGRAVGSTATVDSAYGAHQQDESFLDPLQFGRPDRMYAIPLVARGRGVAVMYADHGSAGGKVNVEALETLVRVAGLTVELLAASQTAQAEGRETAAADFEQAGHEHAEQAPAPPPSFEAPSEPQPTDFAFSESAPSEDGYEAPAPAAYGSLESTISGYEAPAEEPAAETFEHEAERVSADDASETSGAMVFDSGGSIEPAAAERSPSPFETTAQAEPAGVGVMAGVMPERGIEVSPVSAGHTRLSERPVDLPIDVAEDERRLHNDARRFARLLVSEIKLYNEKKVQEGRQANDLYERLREAIDRSREMYDKRVQPPVAAKFDYFHYELVNSLADGNAERLGSGYPGSTV